MKVPRSGRPHHIGVYYGAKAADCRAVWRRALITGDLRFGAKQTLGFILIVLFPSNIKAGVCRFPASLRKAFFSSLMIISAVEGQLRGRLCDYAERDAKMGTWCTVPSALRATATCGILPLIDPNSPKPSRHKSNSALLEWLQPDNRHCADRPSKFPDDSIEGYMMNAL